METVGEKNKQQKQKNKKQKKPKRKVELVPSSVHYVQLIALLGGLAALIIRTGGRQENRTLLSGV